MCPPTGFRPSAPANRALAPGSDWTWFVWGLGVSGCGEGRDEEGVGEGTYEVEKTITVVEYGMGGGGRYH